MSGRWRQLVRITIGCLPWLLPGALLSTEQTATVGLRQPPAISIVIDDMGNHPSAAALALPGAVTYAFLPHTPYADHLAQRAHERGKEVMLHLPMESHNGAALGPGGLTLHMTETAFKRTLRQGLRAVPHAVGLNNHMGSLLTRHPGAMAWIMDVLRDNRLFFIDSRTTAATVAESVAFEYRIPHTRRDVFLDNRRSPSAIRSQFHKLLAKAREQGSAVGIGHPYPETISVLQAELSKLDQRRYRLLPVSELIAIQQRSQQWPAPSSPSLKVAKNSKPSPSSICCAAPE